MQTLVRVSHSAATEANPEIQSGFTPASKFAPRMGIVAASLIRSVSTPARGACTGS